MKSLDEMSQKLKENPNVLGIIEYGSPKNVSDDNIEGDYDIFAILKRKRQEVESLHFYVNKIPVDLNVRTLSELKNMATIKGINIALLDARVIYDPTGAVEVELQQFKERHSKGNRLELSQHDLAFLRHEHRHIFDKTQDRLKKKPLLCKLLLYTNIYRLIESYFSVRNLYFLGAKRSLEYLKKNDPKICKLIEKFYTSSDLKQQRDISKELTELVLKPVRGSAKNDEVLAFAPGSESDLEKEAKDLYKDLFGQT